MLATGSSISSWVPALWLRDDDGDDGLAPETVGDADHGDLADGVVGER